MYTATGNSEVPWRYSGRDADAMKVERNFVKIDQNFWINSAKMVEIGTILIVLNKIQNLFEVNSSEVSKTSS